MSAASADSTRRLIVHMGVQKTGSTSLHHFLQSNQAALDTRLQVLTPRRGSPTRDMGRAAALYTVDPSPETGRREAFIAAIEKVKAQIPETPGTTLISHENLPGAMLGRAGTVTLYPMLEEIVALMDAHFAPMGPEYVIYTRDMVAWKRSAHNQAVRSDGYPGDYETFLAETQEAGDWESLAARLHAAAPGRAHVLQLEDEPSRRHPGSQLLRLAGLAPDDIAALKPQRASRNQSLNSGSLEFMRRINALGLRPKQRRSVAEIVEKNQGLFISTEAAAPEKAPERI